MLLLLGNKVITPNHTMERLGKEISKGVPVNL